MLLGDWDLEMLIAMNMEIMYINNLLWNLPEIGVTILAISWPCKSIHCLLRQR